MNEQLINFETAKLAKEKGFKIPVSHYYFEDSEFKENKLTGTNGYYGDDYCFSLEEFLEDWNNQWVTTKSGDRCFGCNEPKKYFITYSAPTQALLQKWLREIHKMLVWIEPDCNFGDEIVELDSLRAIISTGSIHTCIETPIFNNYERALEAGLIEALKLIK